MQTTLLSIGIAIIVALLAALVGPFFINWSEHRGFFEARAGAALGVPVRIAGAIEVRLLPAPSVVLRDVSIAGPNDRAIMAAREMALELSLGALIRGEWRATEMRAAGAEFRIGLDRDGKVDWAQPLGALHADAIVIDRLNIESSRVVFAPAAGASHVLEDFWFAGDLRSLAGPMKGEGGFRLGNQRHAYRVSSGRIGAEGARVRLSLDFSEREMTSESEGILKFTDGVGSFEGTVALSRMGGVVMVRGRAVNSEPWRLSGRVKAQPSQALFEALELQYGPEERGLKLGGAAEVALAGAPRIDAVLSARQLDLDRLAALPEGSARAPLAILRAAADALGDAFVPSVLVRVGLSVDSVLLAGAPVQNLRGDFVADGAGWEIENLEFRAPGMTQVRAAGRLADSSFAGPATLDAADPKTFAAWLEGRSDKPLGQAGRLRAEGELTLAADRFAVDRLRAEVDGKVLSGRVIHRWAAGSRPARFEASLKADELDLDAMLATVRAAAPGLTFDIPAEFALEFDLRRATFADVEISGVEARLRLDRDGLSIERLNIRDLAGASVGLRGAVAAPGGAPNGTLRMDIAGARLDGIAALLGRVEPEAKALVEALAPHLAPAKLRLTLTLDGQAAPGEARTAKLVAEGNAGALRLALTTDFSGAFAEWRNARFNLAGQIESADGRALLRLLGLDTVAAANSGGGRLTLSSSGRIADEWTATSRLAVNGVDVGGNGTLRWNGGLWPSGRGDLSVNVSDVIALRTLGGGRAALVFRSPVTFSPQAIAFEGLNGSFGSSGFNGDLKLTVGSPLRVEGRLDAEFIDASALVAALLGVPASGVRAAAISSVWPTTPFADPLPAGIEGRIDLKASRARIAQALELRHAQATVRWGGQDAAIEDVAGMLANGRFVGGLALTRGVDGVALETKLAVTGADITQLLPGDVRAPVSGRVAAQLEAKGAGRSLASLVGALDGAGTLSVEGADFAGLDPAMFDSVTRAVDQGLSVESARIRGIVERALAHGRLRIARADGTLSLTAGQLRVSGLLAKGERADLALSATADLAQSSLDARLALIGIGGDGAPAAGRPEVFLAWRGPLMAPKRDIDVSALVGWLTLRSVDLQAKRLEQLENERRAADEARASEPQRQQRAVAAPVIEATSVSPPPTTASVTTTAPMQVETPAAVPVTPAIPATTAPAEETPQVATPPAPRATPMPRPRRVPNDAAAPASPVRRAAPEQAPPLPPPVDIRPPPGQRRPNAQAAPASRQAGASGNDANARMRPRPAPQPPRSIMDLFNPGR